MALMVVPYASNRLIWKETAMRRTITSNGTLAPASDNSITGTITSTVTLGSGGYYSPLTITSGGAIIAPAGGSPTGATALIVPADVTDASITNSGRIVGGGGGTSSPGGIGVELASSVTLTNSGTITGGAGGDAGVTGNGGGGGIGVYLERDDFSLTCIRSF